jgi:rubrerythrin
MTERRPQWDDDLIDTVRSHFYENGFVEEVFGVIAAVEDWHRDRWTGVCESPEEVARELKQAQAAIQRVRELHRTVVDEVFTDFGWDGEVEHCQECGYVPTDDEPCPTLAALNTATWLRSLTDGGVA